ncbi:MAG: glycogen synthase GlgA [Acidobacteriia bacterium]|nr:glycogen synthase GlgA [Terriglobia bacterium]
MKILLVASEGVPYAKTGGLADVVGGLSKALVEAGHEVAVVLPRYRGIKPGPVVKASVTVAQGGALRFPAITGGRRVKGVRYFFVEDAEYFDREGIYGDRSGDYADNAERYGEFCRAAIEIVKQVWPAEVIHCHDWQAGLLPVLLRSEFANDPAVNKIPVVFTIHNMGYHGLFEKEALERAGIPESEYHPGGLEFFDSVNLLKGGLVYADYLTTVSRKYAEEIQTPEFGHGLDGVVRERRGRLRGILNGADYAEWNPETDRKIAANYSAAELRGKKKCRADLLEAFHLGKNGEGRAVVGMVSRFAGQKGFDLIEEQAEALLKEDLLLVALGQGEERYEKMFKRLAAKHAGRAGVKIAYNDELAHKIVAGADIFLMPSRYEPCGLSQIYSLKYGTVPVVRATGGLDDTIEAVDPATGTGTGFKFAAYTGEAMMGALREALTCYKDDALWRKIQAAGMGRDFSWKASAAEYGKLYEEALAGRNQMRGAASKV